MYQIFQKMPLIKIYPSIELKNLGKKKKTE